MPETLPETPSMPLSTADLRARLGAVVTELEELARRCPDRIGNSIQAPRLVVGSMANFIHSRIRALYGEPQP